MLFDLGSNKWVQRWTEGTRGRGWLWGQVWGHKSVFFMLQIRSRCWWDYTNSVITHPTVPAVHKMYIPRYYYFVSLDELKCKNTNFMKNIIARPNCSESVPPGDCCKHYIGLSQCHMCGGSVDLAIYILLYLWNGLLWVILSHMESSRWLWV